MPDAARGPSHPLVELTGARVREFVRDPAALFWTFGFPIVLAVVLGIAFREAPPRPVVVAVERETADAPRLVKTLGAAPGVEAHVMPAREARRALSRSRVDLVVSAGDGGSDFTYRWDRTRPEGHTARLAVHDALERAGGRADLLHAKDETRREPGGRYIDFLVPGLIGLSIMGSAVWGIGFAVVDARKRRLLKRLSATPMSRAHYLLSFMLSRLILLVLEVALLTAFGWGVFGVAVRGSVIVLAIVAVWGSLALAGVAMLIAARPRSTEVAAGVANLFMLPSWLVGGAFFSYERFPEPAQPFIRAVPLAALNDALRKVMNEGLGLGAVVRELATLAVWGIVSFVIALRVFRWQ